MFGYFMQVGRTPPCDCCSVCCFCSALLFCHDNQTQTQTQTAVSIIYGVSLSSVSALSAVSLSVLSSLSAVLAALSAVMDLEFVLTSTFYVISPIKGLSKMLYTILYNATTKLLRP